jgi:hypothetical protein
MKFILHERGDSSVGISDYYATVEVNRTPDPEFTEDEIEALKSALSDALIDGGIVMTEAEAAAEAKATWPEPDDLCAAPEEFEDHVSVCTRPEPHICRVNGPCNGWPKPNNDTGVAKFAPCPYPHDKDSKCPDR